MTREKFFEKFELFAQLPGAVAKMRELVLELAVQGRLVEQDAADEPASVLLQRVTATAKVVRSARRESPEAPFKIPESWTWVRLPRVLKKLTDGTHHSPPNGPAGEYMYVTAKNIKPEGVNLSGITYVSRKVHEEIYSRCDPSYGDVLYIKDGATTGIAAINQLEEPFSMLSSVALLKPSEAMVNRYLLWMMRSPFFYKQTRNAMKGAAITRVTLSVMAASLLPLPPLAEQKRIVAKLDELMALCDQLDAQQKERETHHAALARASLSRFTGAPTRANLTFLFHNSYTITAADVRETILTLAVQGRLAAQDVNDEPADCLLEKIDRERLTRAKSGRMSPSRPFDFAAEDELGYRLPDGWAVAPLVRLVLEIQTGPFGSSLHQSDYEPGGTPVVNPASLKSGRIVPITTMLVGAQTAKRLDAFRLNEGDIVMARRGEMGRCAIVTANEHGWLCGTGSLVLRTPKSGFPPYLALLIGSPPSRAYLGGSSVGTTMQNLNQSILGRMPVAVPPLAEQRRIVAKVNQLMELVDELEGKLDASRDTAAKLLDAVIGELIA